MKRLLTKAKTQPLPTPTVSIILARKNIIHQNETYMEKFRRWLIAFASIIIIVQLFFVDFKDLSWSNNAGSYLGILSMVSVIISMFFSNRHDKNSER